MSTLSDAANRKGIVLMVVAGMFMLRAGRAA